MSVTDAAQRDDAHRIEEAQRANPDSIQAPGGRDPGATKAGLGAVTVALAKESRAVHRHCQDR